MSRKLDSVALASSAAIVAAVGMVLLGVAGYVGVYEGAVGAMQTWHMFFAITPVGIVTGAIEAAVWTVAFTLPVAALYNRLVGDLPTTTGAGAPEGR